MAQPKIISQIKLKANLDSPNFSGTPTVPTAVAGTNNTQAASTAFVKNALNSYSSLSDTKNTAGSTNLAGTKLFVIGATTQAENPQTYSNEAIYISDTNVLMGAAWNDFAEFRSSEVCEPGRVICENGDGTLSLAQERLQPGAEVISDTYGFAIGETEQCQTPVAIVGRVLACPSGTLRIGDAVCAGPRGTVSAMTREEIKEYPDRIIGIVSEIPTYEYWNDKVKVNGRVWIRIK